MKTCLKYYYLISNVYFIMYLQYLKYIINLNALLTFYKYEVGASVKKNTKKRRDTQDFHPKLKLDYKK